MSVPNPRIKLTYRDYAHTPEDERYELLDGELIITPAPAEVHQRVATLLGWRVAQFVSENDLGRVYVAPFDVVLSDTDVVQPDLLFISNERVHVVTPANVQGAPDLVVEILSPTSAERDRTFKRRLYARLWSARVLDRRHGSKGRNRAAAPGRGIRGGGHVRRGSDADVAHAAGLRLEGRRPVPVADAAFGRGR